MKEKLLEGLKVKSGNIEIISLKRTLTGIDFKMLVKGRLPFLSDVDFIYYFKNGMTVYGGKLKTSFDPFFFLRRKYIDKNAERIFLKLYEERS